MTALRAFAVAVRCKSFTEAAEELEISQAAVSRQIINLENFFSTKLFVRGSHGVRLTEAGRDLAKNITPAFELIESASLRLLGIEKMASIHVRTYQTFALNWLMPRLDKFKEVFPDYEVRLDTDVERGRNQVRRFDIAILLSDGNGNDVNAHLMFDDVIEPVCSPEFLSRHGPLKNPSDLIGLPLLHSTYRRADWADWLTSVGGTGINPGAGQEFTSSILTYRAAKSSLGIAMGQHVLVEQDLADGTLVKILDLPFKRNLSYYILLPNDREVRPKTRAFVNWVLSECGRKTIFFRGRCTT
jgi:LysR family glycine cleavage system transcriptional activator